MPKFTVKRKFQGFVHGWEMFEVEADSPQDAKNKYSCGIKTIWGILREDTHTTDLEVSLALDIDKVTVAETTKIPPQNP